MTNSSSLRWLIGPVVICLTLTACSSSDDDDQPLDDPVNTSLTDAQLTTLPDDCLTALDQLNTAYCFSPRDRNLMAIFPDGSTHWRYPLPGDNNSNHLEGIEVIDDTLILIADGTVEFGDLRYEISRFEFGGAFIDTLPILDPFIKLNGDFATHSAALNLDGDDLIIVADDSALFIGALAYELVPGGNRSERTDWIFAGSSITRVKPDDGSRQAYRLLPEARIEKLETLTDQRLEVTADGIAQRFDTSDLSADTADPTIPLLHETNIPRLVPFLFQQLQASYLEALRADLTAIIDTVAIPIDSADPECIAQDPANRASCFGEITTGPVTQTCALEGAVTETRYALRRFDPGFGDSTEAHHTYVFDACRLDIVGNFRLSNGAYRLSGEFETKDDQIAIRQGSRSFVSLTFTNLTLTYPDGGSIQTTGSQTDSITRRSSALIERNIAVETFKSTVTGSTLDVSNLNYDSERENHEEPNRRVSISGSMAIRSPATSDQQVNLRIDPPLANLYWQTDPVTLSGTVQIDAEDGSSITIVAMENPAVPGDEQLHYQASTAGGAETTVKPFESLLIPFY